MINDTTFNPVQDWSDDDDLGPSILNNSAESVRQGLACGGLEEPSHNLKPLVNFAYKIKREQ